MEYKEALEIVLELAGMWIDSAEAMGDYEAQRQEACELVEQLMENIDMILS